MTWNKMVLSNRIYIAYPPISRHSLGVFEWEEMTNASFKSHTEFKALWFTSELPLSFFFSTGGLKTRPISVCFQCKLKVDTAQTAMLSRLQTCNAFTPCLKWTRLNGCDCLVTCPTNWLKSRCTHYCDYSRSVSVVWWHIWLLTACLPWNRIFKMHTVHMRAHTHTHVRTRTHMHTRTKGLPHPSSFHNPPHQQKMGYLLSYGRRETVCPHYPFVSH